jgi:fibronectin type 3 domain-containing protein
MKKSLGMVAAALAAVAAFSASAPARTTAAPVSTGQPAISGSTTAGAALHVNNGTWSGGPTSYRYQWYLCDNPGKTNCKPIANATANDYRLQSGDAGHTLYADVTAANRDGANTKATDAVGPIRPNAAPANTAAPSVSGTPAVGQTVTAVEGSWTQAPSAFSYQWLRCDASGNNCGAIAGATARTYAVSSDDVGSTLRIRVNARNSRGNDTATSPQSAGVGTGTGGTAIPVTSVSLPNQLVVGDVKFAPAVLHSRAPFTARITVTDGRNRPVAGALVYVLGLPYAWMRSAAEVSTGNDGIATLTLSPTQALPGKASIVLFVRVRKPGDPLVGASVASRRLVQVTARF